MPYNAFSEETQIIEEFFLKGLYPLRPTHPRMLDEYWTFIMKCWTDPPPARPTIGDAQGIVQQFYEACCTNDVVLPKNQPEYIVSSLFLIPFHSRTSAKIYLPRDQTFTADFLTLYRRRSQIVQSIPPRDHLHCPNYINQSLSRNPRAPVLENRTEREIH